jgi:hypothetical protein
LALFGGLMAALSGGKKTTSKLSGAARKGCGPCGR